MLAANITQVAALMRNGQLSATSLCELCIKRMKRIKELNVFITEVPELALKGARAADNRINNGSKDILEGIPVAFKDNFSTTGIQTSCASRMLMGYIPPYNATVVDKLLHRGSVILGKTNLDEFAMGCGSVDGAFGPVRNPWKYHFKKSQHDHPGSVQVTPSAARHAERGRQFHSSSASRSLDVGAGDDFEWHIAGGSSGGSAVSVASGTVLAAIGSDTGGSTRNPASYCGVVGLKPTYGLVSRHGLIPLVNSMDVPGILTRSVDDAAIILNALAGHDTKDSTTVVDYSYEPCSLPDTATVKGLKIGIPQEYHAPGLSPDMKNSWQNVADILENAGAVVKQVSLPHTALSIVCYHVLCACEVASNMARYDGLEYGHRAKDESSTESLYATSRHEAFNDVVRGRILAGNYFLLKQNYDKYYLQAQRVRRLISRDFWDTFQSGIDILLTPTVLGDAPTYSWFSKADNRMRTQEQDVFTQPANMAGIPAISIPVALSSKGLPLGLQLLGQPFKEQQLLTAAKAIEQMVNFQPLDLNELLECD